jgi:hypothetical protein|tara:strand:+ start:5798 stop:6133 length:336 start_codon:yes stop_codon:yes gene_type:complete
MAMTDHAEIILKDTLDPFVRQNVKFTPDGAAEVTIPWARVEVQAKPLEGKHKGKTWAVVWIADDATDGRDDIKLVKDKFTFAEHGGDTERDWPVMEILSRMDGIWYLKVMR